MHKLKRTLRIISIVTTVLMALIVTGNIYTIAVRTLTNEVQPTFLGFSSAVVISGSMEGTIEVNDFIICREQESYKVSNIVTYIDEYNNLVTHRIVDKTDAGFITQGDANNTPDLTPVTPDRIVGRVVCVIPGLGLLIGYMQTPFGFALLAIIGILLIMLPGMFDGEDSDKKHSSSTQNGGKQDAAGNAAQE